jgi:predicted amidohydrolase
MSTAKIALAQMQVVAGDPTGNAQRAQSSIARAKDLGAELVVLPELWTSGYDLEHAAELSSPIHQGSFALVQSWAQEFALTICGSILEERDGKYFNTLAVYSPTGEPLATYSKIHLFGLMNEPKFLSAGTQTSMVQLPFGLAGLAICYDLRFPELFRSYALQGANLILLSAEWPKPRLEHWRTLIRARAIENQCYVVACNCVGSNGSNEFFGHSLIVDPWGEVLVEGSEDEEVIVGEIDPGKVNEIRTRFPFFSDRREGIYSLP